MESQTLNGKVFLAKLITQYAHIHRKAIGPKADQYIRQLGIRTGEWLEKIYNGNDQHWTIDEYVRIIVDIKNSIGGHFEKVSIRSDHVVVKAKACPFGEAVKDAPHLCMMTSSVFGGIAARQYGYAKVVLRKRIALGDQGCEVAIYFTPEATEEGQIYKDLPITPDHGDPFAWEDETIQMLNEELRKSDEMVLRLYEEIESLKKQVDMDKRSQKP